MIALPFFGQRSNTALTELPIEMLPSVVTDSPEALLAECARQLGRPAPEIAVLAGSEWIATAAMKAGHPTIWLDRAKRARSFRAGRDRRGRWISTEHRWTHPEPVPLIADDLADAATKLLD